MDWAQIRCIFISHINAYQEASTKMSICMLSNVNKSGQDESFYGCQLASHLGHQRVETMGPQIE